MSNITVIAKKPCQWILQGSSNYIKHFIEWQQHAASKTNQQFYISAATWWSSILALNGQRLTLKSLGGGGGGPKVPATSTIACSFQTTSPIDFLFYDFVQNLFFLLPI